MRLKEKVQTSITKCVALHHVFEGKKVDNVRRNRVFQALFEISRLLTHHLCPSGV